MTNKRYFSSLLAICLLIAASACTKINDYLDKAESGGVTEEALFADYVQVEGYLANMYATTIGAGDWMPQTTFTYAAASDDAKCPYNFAYGTVNFNNGTVSPTNNPIDTWNGTYQNIRKANTFLKYIDDVPAKTAIQIDGKPRMKGEGFFMRAWCYAELMKRYGGVPLIDRVLTIDENLNIPRNTVKEVVDFIAKDIDSAMVYLPLSYPVVNAGRITKGAAMMLKARVYLYAASPLHNPAGNRDLWKRAADAHKAVMDLKVYSLQPEYKTVLHVRNSPEIMMQSTINQVWQVVAQDWVRHTEPPSQGGGWGNLQPSQNLVDEFEMANGKMITEAGSGYDPNNPYVGRDPRFDKSIIYNGRKWGLPTGAVINTYMGAGIDALGSTNTASTQTGYYDGKLLDENATLITSYRPGNHYWVFMRYAETLLNYAEALNESSDAPPQEVYDVLNQVRSRDSVKMPPVPTGLGKDDMRLRIRHERRIELCMEPHRFWDVRRWRIGTEVFKDIYGMRITKPTSTTFKYEKFLVESRTYKPAFDLFPIPQSEMERNKALIQNPGY
ncbi:RagB/SusD family nutrient uptake outer membrane protein [Chitinophaga sp. SYP-B3965]|uniref:RagB/SusD family nutrient uptake outer membrane protein n=1 Tax=Chitinophaga sp. SYP-B3965 TaxID=2663120 RepID=UPI001564DB6D|nr:RagB/SusD family nutrient uptake outer membrane protein [Chitinophaga sp. SYP-B3965]